MYIAICDDNFDSAKYLQHELLETVAQQIARIDIYTDATELLIAAEKQQFDILFMDVEFGKASGIELVKKILIKYPGTQIIFASEHDDYYLDVYDVEHIYFLKKPVSKEKLKTAFNTACKKLKKIKNDFLTLSTRSGIFRIALNDILYFEKNRRLILVHTVSGNIHRIYGKFSDIAAQLNPRFVQCHISYMVNFRHVDSLERQNFRLSNGDTVHISKSFYKKTKASFLAYLEGSL